ncbi:MAG: tetratricopeptide repeat protein [Candidatus Heimdallarchaeota archaeon]
MTYSIPEEIAQVEILVSEGKYSSALDELDIIDTTSKLDSSGNILCKTIKGNILLKMGEFEDALLKADEILQNYQYLGNSLFVFDAYTIKIHALAYLNRIPEAFTLLDTSIEILKSLTNESVSDLNQRKATAYLLRGILYEGKNELKRSLDNFLQSLSLFRELDFKPYIAEALQANARIYFKTGDVIRAQLIYQQSLDIYKELGNELDAAYVLNNLGRIYAWKGDYGLALEHSLQSLSIGEELENERAKVIFLQCISDVFFNLGELERSLEYLEKCLSIYEDQDNKSGIASILNSLSRIFYRKGEIEKSLDYAKQSKEIYEQLDEKLGLASVKETLGKLELSLGNVGKAYSLLKESLDLRNEQVNRMEITSTLFWLIVVSIESNSLNQVQTFLHRIQKIIEKQKNEVSELRHRLASALILKTSSKQDILRKAKNMLRGIISDVLLDHELVSLAQYHLCELLIKEIELFHEKDEVQNLATDIDKYYATAKHIESHAMYAESFWLKVQLSMIRHNYQEARIHLDQAQQITEDKGFRKLAMEIPRMRKMLESYFEMSAQPTIDTQVNLVNEAAEPINEEVIRLVNKRTVDMPRLEDEEPVLLIIVFEGGVTIYSKKFSQKEMIDEMFVGGFLTAINSFMHQTFATGGSIERIKHQEYTLLLKGEKPLHFCYVYKGQSFTAIQKLDNIISELKKSVTIWHALVNNLGERLSDRERDHIENMADKIFLEETKQE